VTIGSLLQGGFRLVRERSGAMLIWTVIQLAVTIAMSFATVAILQGNSDALMGGASLDSVQTTYLVQISLLALPELLVGTILYAAVQRAILRPSEGWLGWLRLGMDEVRLFLLLLLYMIVFIIAFLFVGVFVGIFLGIAGGTGTLTLVLTVICLAAGAYFGTKLSLTFPLTLKAKAYSIGAGWNLTKGRFWTLFAAYFISILILLAMGALIMAATEPDYLSAIFQYGFTSPEADQASMHHYQLLMAGTINAQIVINWLLTAIQGAIGYALIGGIAATAVQQLTGDEEGPNETFA
jgi:hypothetical protein